MHFTFNVSSFCEPTSYEVAMSDENEGELSKRNWSTALMNTYVLPNNKKVIGCKWIFKLKFPADRTIERHKVWLVAKGFTQTEGINYLETFSHVVKMTTISVLLALATSQNWHFCRLNVNTTFFHGDLKKCTWNPTWPYSPCC